MLFDFSVEKKTFIWSKIVFETNYLVLSIPSYANFKSKAYTFKGETKNLEQNILVTFMHNWHFTGEMKFVQPFFDNFLFHIHNMFLLSLFVVLIFVSISTFFFIN